MTKENKTKRPPKGSIKFNITLSDEQKIAKENILKHPFNFIHGNAGSGKTLLAVQIALDQFFKRQYNKIIITKIIITIWYVFCSYFLYSIIFNLFSRKITRIYGYISINIILIKGEIRFLSSVLTSSRFKIFKH